MNENEERRKKKEHLEIYCERTQKMRIRKKEIRKIKNKK